MFILFAGLTLALSREIETVDAFLVLRGSSGVAIASALNYYLKYHCNAVYLWQEQQLNLPSPLPRVPKTRKATTFSWRYYYNVCTFGYSSAFWDWQRWQREIDWMAMNGINMPLAFTGQEYVWQRVFGQLGMNESTVRASWFSGAAFLPWYPLVSPCSLSLFLSGTAWATSTTGQGLLVLTSSTAESCFRNAFSAVSAVWE